MKTKRSQEIPAEDLSELDRLVLHEFEGLRPQSVPTRVTTDAGLPADAEAADGAAAERDAVEPGPHGTARCRHGDLLDKEEAAFVRNVVRWLSNRPNRDDLIARIWTELSAADPEGFYDASAEDEAEAAGQTPEIEEEGEEQEP